MERTGARTQKERSDASRRKVIDAVVCCVEIGGVTAATTSKIAKEAGVTWGVLQHQFGSKHQIFVSVLETATGEILDALDQLDTQDKSLEAVVNDFCQVLWSYFSKPIYRASVEILLNAGHQAEDFTETTDGIMVALQSRWLEALKQTDCNADRATRIEASEILETSLSGMAIRRAMAPAYKASLKRHRKLLVKALVATLNGKC